MPKKLRVNASLCDLRFVQEETLAAYEQVDINAAVIVTNARARALLAGHPVYINTSDTVELEDETVELRTVNGSTTLSGKAPAALQYLLVNGRLELAPDAAPALERYVGITVNGLLCGPQGVVERIRGLNINGRTETWPDGAVPLKNNTVLDRFFLLRAKADRYWCGGTLFALDTALAAAVAPLAERGVRFDAARVFLTEGLVPVLGPLLAERAEVTVVPDGTVLVAENAALDAALLRRGTRLLVRGSLKVPAAAKALLPRVEYLHVLGRVLLAQAVAEDFGALQTCCRRVAVTHGRLLTGLDEVQIGRGMLEAEPQGVTVVGCNEVRLAPDIPPELLRQRLWLLDCDEVFCTPAQRDALLPNSRGVDEFGTDGEESPYAPQTAARGADTVCINAERYVL